MHGARGTSTLCIAVAGLAIVTTQAQPTIERESGVTRLLIDGVPTPPIVFFHNTDIPGEKSDRYLRVQVALARDSGIRIYSLPLRTRKQPDGITADWSHADSLIDKFLDVDPEALFILRVYPGPNWSWKAVREKTIPEGEFVRFAQGDSPGLSIASEYFRKGSNDELAEMVRHYEGSPYAPHILAWQPGGPYHEMFLAGYRQKGPDYSGANTRAFREWLGERYETDAALHAAWGDGDVALASAEVPPFAEGRFPMRMGAGGTPIDIFYEQPGEQAWIDFSEYMSDITADRIIEWAGIVKRESSGQSLSAFFYGYTFDLCGSFAGHYKLGRVLDCPDVDILASPYSYADRMPGGAGNFMCPVDSILAHGKLWFNEDDTRASVSDLEDAPANLNLWDELLPDLDADLAVLDRNFGSILTHRAATWWMDLIAGGQFQAPEMWAMLRERLALYREICDEPTGYRPESALIVDERSKLYVKDDWDANWWMMCKLRDSIVKSGTSVGYYTLADFIAGVVPECKAYVFANAFAPSDDEIAAIRARLDDEEATAIWVYAPGQVGDRVEALTGISVELGEGKLGSEGAGRLAGEAWGAPLEVTPRLSPTTGNVLGRYSDGGAASSARLGRDVLLGDLGPTPAVLRKLLEAAGCHIWTSGGEVVLTDGRSLCVHSAEMGDVEMHTPEGVTLAPMGPGDAMTRWWRIGR